jgi:hypothetical protein
VENSSVKRFRVFHILTPVPLTVENPSP